MLCQCYLPLNSDESIILVSWKTDRRHKIVKTKQHKYVNFAQKVKNAMKHKLRMTLLTAPA